MKTLWAVLIVCALFSLTMLRVQGFDPDACSWILLEVPSSGLSPGELKESTSSLIGRQLIKIPGVLKVYQACSHEGTFFQLQYQSEIDSLYMLSKLHQIYIGVRNQLPFGTGPARIVRIETRSPALKLAFRLQKTATEEIILALQELREEVHRIPAVHAVQIMGIPRREAEVVLEPSALRAAGISPLKVLQSVQDSLYDTSIGTWDDGRRKTDLYARSPIRNIHDLGLISIRDSGNPSEGYCLLQELAEITWSGPLYDEDLRIRGNRGYLLEVEFSSEAGVFQKSRSVHEIKNLLRSKPSIIDLENLYDSTADIPALMLWSMISLLFAYALLPKERFWICSAAFSTLLLFYSLGELSLTPSGITGIAVGLLTAAGLLHISPSPSIRALIFYVLILPSYYMLLSLLLLAAYGLSPVFGTWLLNLALSLFSCLLLEGLYSRLSQDPHRLPLRKEKLPFQLFLALLILSTAGLEYGLTLRKLDESVQCSACIHTPPHAEQSSAAPSETSKSSQFSDEPPWSASTCAGNAPFLSLEYSGKKAPDPSNTIAYWLHRSQSEFSLLCTKGRQKMKAGTWHSDSLSLHPSFPTVELPRLFAFLDHQASKPSYSDSRSREYTLQLLRLLVPDRLSRREVFLHVELALEGKIAGEMQRGNTAVRSPVRIRYGKIESPEDLAGLPIFSADGSSIELNEIGRIQDSGPQSRLFRIFRGREK